MKKNIQLKKASLKEDWHPADIVAAVRKAGLSMRKLSIKNGYCPSMAAVALRNPYRNAEQIIADAIGVKPEDIWPSRYIEYRPLRGAGGKPTHKRGKHANKSTNNNSLKKPINVKDGVAE